jgi:hypothetical protein
MDLPSTRKLIGKIDSRGNAVYPQENSFELYETIAEIFTEENDMIGHIYCNVVKFGAVVSTMNRGFWGVEPDITMITEGCLSVAEYILKDYEHKEENSKVSNSLFKLI